MFNFNPFRKFSSFALSKFLTPYFTSIDESQINVGFWKGEIKLTDLQLSQNFFFLNNIDLEVLNSIINEIRIKIPWNAINSQPIEIHISGLKLEVSNVLQRSKKQKKEMKEQLNKLKKEALLQYDMNLNKSSQNETPIYLSNLIQNLMQNSKIVIEDISIIFVYQIKDFELVKFGLSIDRFSMEKSEFEGEMQGFLKKLLSFSKFSLFFEFYDSVHVENLENDAKNLNKIAENKRNSEKKETNNASTFLEKNYIISNFDFCIDIKVEFLQGMAIEVKINANPIQIFLRQKQMRHLIRALEAILYYRADRPEIKPGISRGSALWWKYAFKRILQEEKIPLKIKNKDILIFYKAEKYKTLYAKSKLTEKEVTTKEKIFLQSFEESSSLSEILSLRNIALETIAIMKQKLNEDSEKQQKLAREWFDQLKIENPAEIFGDYKLNLQKKEEQPFTLQGSVNIKRIDILIQENEMFKSLKKLHNYVTVFSDALEEKRELKQKILNHIKENFVQEISTQQRFLQNYEFEQDNNFIYNDSPNKLNENQIYLQKSGNKLNSISKKPNKKMLLQISLHSFDASFEIKNFVNSEIRLHVEKIEGIDMHKLNNHYKKFLEIPLGVSLFITSQSSKAHMEGFEDWLMKINVELNLEIFQMTLSKPFIERIISLIQMVNFDPKKFYDDALKKNKYEAERQSVFFNSILIEKKKLTREINLSLNIPNINFYFPFEYSTKDNMLLIQLKDLKLYKREDQNEAYISENLPYSNKTLLLDNSSMKNPANKRNLLEFNPIFLRINCLKVLIISDYSWEVKENLFLRNLNKLTPQKQPFFPQKPQNEENSQDTSKNSNNFSKILIETLPISLRIERFKTLMTIHNEDFMEEREIKRLHYSDKNITPQTTKIFINLPMIIVKITISQLFSLVSLINTWSQSGPDLYKAVMDDTNQNKPKDFNKNPKKTLNNNNISSNGNLFAQRNVYVDPNINYNDIAVEEILESLEISSVNLVCDGINLCLFAKSYGEKDFVLDKCRHNNELFSFFVDKIEILESKKYFVTERIINIKKILLQNHNCLDIDLKNYIQSIINRKINKKQTRFSFDNFKEHHKEDKKQPKTNEFKEKIKDFEDKKEENHEENKDDDSFIRKLSKELIDLSKIKQNNADNIDDPLSLFEKSSEFPEENAQKNPNLNPLPHFFCEFCHENLTKAPAKQRLLINSTNSSPKSSEETEENNIKISIKTQEKEMERLTRKKITYQNIDIKLSDFILVIDPIVIQSLRCIFDLSCEYTQKTLTTFKKFMRHNGFWPDFEFHEQNLMKTGVSPSTKSEEADSKVFVVVNSLTLLFHYKRLNLYVFNVKTLKLLSEDFKAWSNLRISGEHVSLHDTSRNSGNHTDLILDYNSNKPSQIHCEIKLYDDNFSNIMKFSTSVGVRITNAKVLFLKRIVNELVDYMRKHVFPSFDSQQQREDSQKSMKFDEKTSKFGENLNKSSPEKAHSTLKFELLIVDSVVTLYQNSVLNNLFFVEFSKLCIWSTGLWGQEMGQLLRTGFMDYERKDQSFVHRSEENFPQQEEMSAKTITLDSIPNISESQTKMKNSIYRQKSQRTAGEKEKVVDSLDGLLFYETFRGDERELAGKIREFFKKDGEKVRKSGWPDDKDKSFKIPRNFNKDFDDLEEEFSREESQERSGSEKQSCEEIQEDCKEIYKINVEGLKILTSKESMENESLFAKMQKESMHIEINLEDEDFVKERLVDDFQDNEGFKPMIWPITINLKIKKLWLYAYEPDFALLMNILQENLGEVQQTVQNDAIVNIANNNIYLYVKVCVDNVLIKLFKGSREDLSREGSKRNIFSNPKPTFLYKNSSSLALISVNDVLFKMLMQENGGKKMILSIDRFNLCDLRMNSKLMHYNKSVLFSLIPNQFIAEESTMTTTTQDPPSPMKEPVNENNIAINFFENSNQVDHRLEVESDFDEENKQENLQNNEKNMEDFEEKGERKNKNRRKSSILNSNRKKKVNFSNLIKNNPIEINDKNANENKNNNANEPMESSHLLNSQKRKSGENPLENNNNNIKNNPKPTWKEKTRGFFAQIFRCCRRNSLKTSKKKKNITNLFNLISEENMDIISRNRRNSANFASSNNQENDYRKPLNLKEKSLRINSNNENDKENFNKGPNQIPIIYEIHSLKDVKQPTLEDLEEDDVKNFQRDAELKLVFISKYDSEKLVKIKIVNKNLILVIDLISDLVSFFMKPFDGTAPMDYIQKKQDFNNNPPMIVKLELSNIYLILLADYNVTNINTESISILLDLAYEHKWLGDAYVGPGSIDMTFSVIMKKFFLFKTFELMKDEFIKGDQDIKANFQFFNLLVEQIEIKYLSCYSLAFYTRDKNLAKRRQYDPKGFFSDKELMFSFNEKNLSLKNPNGKKEIHVPIKKIKVISKIISLLAQPSLFFQEPPMQSLNNHSTVNQNHNNNNVNNNFGSEILCIEHFEVNLEQINIHILKNKNKIQYFKLIFKEIKLFGIRKNNNFKIKLVGTISIDYFNKRRMDFEPFLEPWTFLLTTLQISDDFQLVLQNMPCNESDAFFVKDNKNSLNFNITTACMETLLEAYKFFCIETLDENEPCKLSNKMGCMIRFRNAKIQQEKQKYQWLKPQKNCDIWAKFKPKKPSRSSKSASFNHIAVNILLVNKDLSSFLNENLPIEEKPLEEDAQQQPIYKSSLQTAMTQKPQVSINTSNFNISGMNSKVLNDKRPKKMSTTTMKKASVTENNEYFEGNYKELETIFENSEIPLMNKSNNELTNNERTRDQGNMYSKAKSKRVYQVEGGLDLEKDHKLSDYRMIKDVSLDHVGKTVYKLERINRIDQHKMNSNKNIFGIDINFDSLDFLSKTRKINEEGNTYMLVDVRFSPKKGYKEIYVTTSVKFLNKLNTDIDISFFWKYKKNALETTTLKPDHEYYIPLKFIEASTLVTFKSNRIGGYDYISWEDENKETDDSSLLEENNEDDMFNHFATYNERNPADSPDNRRNASPNLLGKSLNIPEKSAHPQNNNNYNAQSINLVSNVSTINIPINKINEASSIGKGILSKGQSMDIANIKGGENREKSASNAIGPLGPRVPISAEFEKYDLDKFIGDKLTMGEFEQVEEHELFKKEHSKKGLLVYKNDFVVNSIHHHGKASYGNFYFILSCVKSKMETHKRHNKEREEICYETTLILLPIFKITNLTMSPLVIEYGGFANTSKKKQQKTQVEDHKYSKKILFPKSSYGCTDIYYGDDLSFNVALRAIGNEGPITENQSLKSKDIKIYKYEKNLQIPIKLKAKIKAAIYEELKDITDYRGKNFYLWAEFKKTSPKSREIVVFSPYLIIDETNKLYFKESSSFLSPRTYQKYFKSITLNKGFTGKSSLNSQIFGQPMREENFEDLLDKTNMNNPSFKEKVKKDLEILKKIHMFSPSKKMKAIQIALKGSFKIWSKPCPLQTTEDVLSVVEAPMDRDLQVNEAQQRNNNNGYYENVFNSIINKTIKRNHYQKQARKKYQFGVKIMPAPSPFFRSKLIIFSPRYMIKNECDNLIAIAQYDTEHSEEDIIRIRKDQWHEFHWTDHKKKEFLVLSLCNKVTGNVYGWSGRFKIDKVQEIVVKLRKDQENEFEFTKVSINIHDNINCIRIMNEDKENPPYSLHNETNHEISFRHKIKIGNKRNQEEVPFTILYPGDSLNFTWEQWDDENDRILQVEIDGQLKDYPIEKTQECEPFILNPKHLNKQSKAHVYKQGYLKISINEKKKKENYYCVLSVANQKIKYYETANSKKNTINLKGAKIENSLENEFFLKTSKNVNYQFEAKNEAEKNDWMGCLWKSILLENPEIIFVKIEPENLTKAIKFYTEGEDFLIPFNENEEDDERKPLQRKKNETTYTFKISNAIGISIIDSLPREIVHISIKKIEVSLFSIENYNIEEKAIDAILVEKGENIVKTSYINISIDSFIVNDQLTEAQFPVILAPNKKKTNEFQQFFIAFIQTKNVQKSPNINKLSAPKENIIPKEKQDSNIQISKKEKNIQRNKQISSLTHVEQFKIVFDSMEIRIEDLLLEALYDFYLEISPALNNLNLEDVLKKGHTFDIRPLETKLGEKLKENNNNSKQMVYIKRMLFHPIEICFSFRDNPGQQKKSLMKSWGSYLGISFISIDSAKLKLGLLDQLHFFGSSNDVFVKISKHYKKFLWNQLKKIFFSMDILGNPYSLGESVAVGLKEIVFNPMQDLVKLNFDKFGKGIALGSVGFVKNTITSVYTSLERILGTIMKTFSKMTRDKEYLYSRQIMKNRAIKRVREGVYIGFKNLFKILTDVVFQVPRIINYEIKSNGCLLGFALGLYGVAASVIIKPIVGIYDLLTVIIEGIKNSDKYEGHIMEVRSRPTRIFNQENLVVPYDYNPAMLKFLVTKYKLREIDAEHVEYFDEFTIISKDFLKRSKETIFQLILTDYRLLFAEKMSAIFCKKISLHKIKKIKFDENRKVVIFKFQVPMQKKYCCKIQGMNFEMPIESREKAIVLAKTLKEMKEKGQLELKGQKKFNDFKLNMEL